MQTFDRRFAVLRDVLVDFDRCCGKAGGEALERARGQTEEEELYHFHSGFLRLAGAPADLVPPLRHAWLQAILSTVEQARNGRDQAKQKRELTLMAVRYGYANMFHTVTDLYNAFLVLRFLRQSPQRTRVILADGHPASPLDPLWMSLFGETTRISAWKGRHRFGALVLNPLGLDSPLELLQLPGVPLVEEFRTFVLRRMGASAERPRRPPVRVTFVWRRNYHAHPRNPAGVIHRKIANEKELIDTLQGHRFGTRLEVKAVVLEELTIAEQLRVAASTDLLVGMHGAGLAHTLFLPPGAGLVELFPAYFSPESRYFRRMAEWRGLYYQGWQNTDPRREIADFRTEIPPEVVIEAVRRYVERRR